MRTNLHCRYYLTGNSISSNTMIIIIIYAAAAAAVVAAVAANQSNSNQKVKRSKRKSQSSWTSVLVVVIGTHYIESKRRVRLTNRHQHNKHSKATQHNTPNHSECVQTDAMRAFNSLNGNMCRQYLSWAIAYNAIINISMLSKHI